MTGRVNLQDLAAGGVFVAIGLFFALGAWFDLRIGSALSMGPGYFPLLLGGVLTALGGAIALKALIATRVPFGATSWRGLTMTIVAIVFFAATVRGLGLAPSLFIATMTAAGASGQVNLRLAALLGAALTFLCVAIFIWGLGLRYATIGPWLGGQ
ncbi:MAG: hypothetical protein C6Y20_05795 [Tagaea sp. CACIAM 22H2]|nr:hypothetical protein [Tagaea sp. CACIAM 22H2]